MSPPTRRAALGLLGGGLALLAAGPARGSTLPARVVTLGAALGETVLALGHGARIVAADAGSAVVPGLEDRATLGYHRQVSAEGVLAARPDLVLATTAAGPPAALDQIAAAGVRLLRLDDAPTLAGVTARIRAVGAAFAAGPAAESLLQTIEADLAAARADAPHPAPRVLFVYARGGGALQIAGRDTAADLMIRLAGGENALGASTGYVALTPEAVAGARPAVLLLTTRGLEGLGGEAALRATPGVAGLPGLRVVALEDGLLLGLGPRTGAGARALARALAGAGRP